MYCIQDRHSLRELGPVAHTGRKSRTNDSRIDENLQPNHNSNFSSKYSYHPGHDCDDDTSNRSAAPVVFFAFVNTQRTQHNRSVLALLGSRLNEIREGSKGHCVRSTCIPAPVKPLLARFTTFHSSAYPLTCRYLL